ncbi:hypothetical protein RJT34_26667 [Clitoria ternatea]|uniref:Uncharacterized protein n=1 Tax=Clitoria ternatea TaxID=43366 RepID=A0AAN9F744_CLITE
MLSTIDTTGCLLDFSYQPRFLQKLTAGIQFSDSHLVHDISFVGPVNLRIAACVAQVGVANGWGSPHKPVVM